MTQREPDENRARNIRAMGALLGELFTDLYSEIFWLNVLWRQYVALYGTTARVDLLRSAADYFFGVIDEALWESVLLSICRLTDTPTVGRRKRKTLSIAQLPGAIQDPELSRRVRMLVGQTTRGAGFARDWRDRRIAHRDLELVQSPTAPPLAEAYRESVDAVLASLTAVANALEVHYFASETTFNYISHPTDAELLIYQLRLARMVLDEREARWKSGECRDEDFREPPKI